MDNDRGKAILDFYLGANNNKEKIIYDSGEERPYSLAEATAISCIDELLIDDDDKMNRIKYLLLNSLSENLNGLTKGYLYEEFLENLSLVPKPTYNSRSMFRELNKYQDSNEIYDKFLTLRNKIRQGHIYWGANGDRLESILEHIYGCLTLVVGIDSEYDYKLDYDKMIKMLLLHETEEIIIGDLTEWDISKEEKELMGKKAINELLSDLKNGNELIDLIDEFNDKKTLESEYANLIDKLEYDMQVKVYELEGRYDFSNYPDNVVTRSNSVKSIINNGAKSVFEVHYEYDKYRYSNVPCLKRILEETKNI